MTRLPAGGGTSPLVGAHMSAAGGLGRAVERAVAAGCRTLQVFTKNSNQWAGKPIGEVEAAAFRRDAAAAGLDPLVAHSSYLINLASPDALVRGRSVAALADEVERCDATGIAYLVLHPGSHGGDGEETGLDRIARGLDEALAAAPASRTTVLLETAAGQGSCLGHELRQLGEIPPRNRLADQFPVTWQTKRSWTVKSDQVSTMGGASSDARYKRVLAIQSLASM